MGRPKASDTNKAMALAFCNAVTVDCGDAETYIERSGSSSIYSALEACLPAITRYSKVLQRLNRDGVSEVELNKLLCRSGYKSVRKRPRLKDVDNHGTNGTNLWSNRRWINLALHDDVSYLSLKVEEMAGSFPETRCLNLDLICSALTTMGVHSPMGSHAPQPVHAVSTGMPAAQRGGHHTHSAYGAARFDPSYGAGSHVHGHAHIPSHVHVSQNDNIRELNDALTLATQRGWNFEALAPFWTCGYATGVWVHILQGLPGKLSSAIRSFLIAVKIVEQHRAACHHQAYWSDPGARTVGGEEMQRQVLLDMMDADPAVGVFQLILDPHTRVAREVYVNHYWAHAFRTTKEELMTLLSHYAAPIPCPQLDTLFILLTELLRFFEDVVVLHLRMMTAQGSEVGRQFSLVRMTVRNSFNAVGQLIQVDRCFCIISPEEYDIAILRTPRECPLHLMGDKRRGQQLLDEGDGDMRRRIVDMRETATGAAVLEHAGHVFTALSDEIVRVAMSLR